MREVHAYRAGVSWSDAVTEEAVQCVCMSLLSLQVSVHPSQLREGFGLAPSQIKRLEISSQGRSHNAQRDKTTAETDEGDEEVQAYFKGIHSHLTAYDVRYTMRLANTFKILRLAAGPSWFF
jgi:hypothetical protein